MDGKQPQFSVIIPTYRRSGHLSSCLRALAAMEYPRERFEVIVADDGSPQPAVEGLRSAGAGLELKWIRLVENRGPAAARNEGSARARGRYLAFIDDDCLPSRDWLNRLEQALAEAPECGAGGRVVNGHPRNVYAAVNQAILDEVYRHYNAEPSNCRFFATMNFAVPAKHFREVGGFDSSYRTSEDREFCARWLERGLGLIYAAEAVVVHDSEPGLSEFWSRHYSFGHGAYRFRRARATQGGGRVRLEAAGFYLRLIFAPLPGGSGWRQVFSVGLACLSQVASGMGFWAARRRNGSAR